MHLFASPASPLCDCRFHDFFFCAPRAKGQTDARILCCEVVTVLLLLLLLCSHHATAAPRPSSGSSHGPRGGRPATARDAALCGEGKPCGPPEAPRAREG